MLNKELILNFWDETRGEVLGLNCCNVFLVSTVAGCELPKLNNLIFFIGLAGTPQDVSAVFDFLTGEPRDSMTEGR